MSSVYIASELNVTVIPSLSSDLSSFLKEKLMCQGVVSIQVLF